MWRSELYPAKLDHSEPDLVEPNQGLHHQIVMCRQKREQSVTKIKWNSPPPPIFFYFVHSLIL